MKLNRVTDVVRPALSIAALVVVFAGATIVVPVTLAQDQTETVDSSIASLLAEAKLEFSKGDYQPALQAYDAVLQQDPNNVPALIGRGTTYVALVQADKGIVDLNAALRLDPRNPDALAGRAIANINFLKIDDAFSDAQQAVKFGPNNAMSYYALGRVYLMQSENEKAIDVLNKALDIDPAMFVAWVRLADAQLNLGDYQESVDSATKAISLNDHYPSAYDVRGYALATLRHFDEAFSDFDKAIELRPDYADYYADRGYAHRIKGETELAQADFTKAIELDSENWYAYGNRGMTYYFTNETQKAIDDLDKAIALKPDTAWLYEFRGQAWMDAAEADGTEASYRKALSDFDKTLDLDPTYTELYLDRGDVYNALGDEASALKDYSAAIKDDPDDEMALYSRASILVNQSRWDEAEADLNHLTELDATDGDYYHLLSYVEKGQGKDELATQDCLRAVNLWGESLTDLTIPATGGSVKGDIDDWGTQLSFTMPGTAGSTVTWTTQTDPSDELDTIMVVRQPSGEPVACVDDISETDWDSQFTLKLPQTGEYTVIVGAVWGEAMGNVTLKTDVVK